MQGGYLMIDLADVRLFERLRIGMTVGKPILIQDGSQNYFIDRITGGNPIYDEDDILTGYSDIILLSANGSITITDANVVTKDYVADGGNHLYALTFNVSDMYYTIFTKISCGMNNKVINDNSDDYTEITLTDDEKTALCSAFESALKNGNNYLINSIAGDEPGYISYSSDYRLLFKNNDADSYTINITFTNNDIVIIDNPNDDAITLYEQKLF